MNSSHPDERSTGAPMTPQHRFLIVALSLFGLAVSPALGQVKTPKPPESYDVDIRYFIQANRNDRIKLFERMTAEFAQLGFKETPTEDSDLAILDPDADRMIGTMPSTKARKLKQLNFVQTILLQPAGYKLPDNATDRVKVLLELNTGLARDQQRIFADQTRLALNRLGYKDAIAYDSLGYTILRGTMPAGEVVNLVKDLRTQPSGWFVSETAEEDLPEPFRTNLPIRLIEILPEPEGTPAALPIAPALPAIQGKAEAIEKLSVDLRKAIAKDGNAANPRLEATFLQLPEQDNALREYFQELDSSILVEGRVGSMVTLRLPKISDATRLAELPNVVLIRLPRPAVSAMPSQPPEPKKEELKAKETEKQVSYRTQEKIPEPISSAALSQTKLERLHDLGFRGQRTKVVIIDVDFTGYEKYLGKGLPTKTKLIDLTIELDPMLKPAPSSTPADSIGHGTHCALAAALASPMAEFYLIRIDPQSPYQLINILQSFKGGKYKSLTLETRQDQLKAAIKDANEKVDKAVEAYRKAFENFSDDDAAQKARDDARAQVADAKQREQLLMTRLYLLEQYEQDLFNLQQVNVIICPLVWTSGQTMEANSPLSRAVDDLLTPSRTTTYRNNAKQPKLPYWFQAAGDIRSQIWTGLFQDVDQNGAMEFVPWGSKLGQGRWTPELNFLAFQSKDQESTFDLPANAQLRITIQWREPHDPEVPENEYRKPISPLNLTLVHQRDPSGEKLPNDEVEVVARSEGAPQRLHKQKEFAIFEQTLEVTLPTAGRFALWVEGQAPFPTTLQPKGFTLPAQNKKWQLQPRILVEVIDSETASKGRVIFGDFMSGTGGVAIPADARAAMTIGAAKLDRTAYPDSAVGAGPSADLLQKPDLWAYADLPLTGKGPAQGTALASSFAGGLTASLISAGLSQSYFHDSLGLPKGYLFEIPAAWFNRSAK